MLLRKFLCHCVFLTFGHWIRQKHIVWIVHRRISRATVQQQTRCAHTFPFQSTKNHLTIHLNRFSLPISFCEPCHQIHSFCCDELCMHCVIHQCSSKERWNSHKYSIRANIRKLALVKSTQFNKCDRNYFGTGKVHWNWIINQFITSYGHEQCIRWFIKIFPKEICCLKYLKRVRSVLFNLMNCHMKCNVEIQARTSHQECWGEKRKKSHAY